ACSDPENVPRPEGWTDETHGSKAEPDYAAVFAPDEVKRLDITIGRADWKLMLRELEGMFGAFGAGIDNDTLPSQWYEVCDDLQLRDDCACRISPWLNLEGTCTRLGPEEQLGCLPFKDEREPPKSALMVPDTPVFKACSVRVADTAWTNVGIRFRGNASLKFAWQLGSLKLPFKFDFDEFEDRHPQIRNQRFYGFKELALVNNFGDPSFVREKLAYDLYRDAGVPAPRSAFYRVYVDSGEGPVYFGLYTMVEVPDEPLLEAQFGGDGGNLYKPDGYGAYWMQFQESAFEKKSNQDEADFSDVQAAIAALHADRGDPARWREGLEAVFNVNGFLRWLAVNTVIQNWDTYGSMSHNYYLYNDPKDGRLHWFPWDNTVAFNSRGGLLDPLALDFHEVRDDWPLIRFMIDDPVYRQTYLACVNEAAAGVFAPGAAAERFRSAHALIAPYVVGAEGEQEGYTTLNDPQEFALALEQLVEHAAERSEAVQDFLAGERFESPGVVINEIHYNPDADQGGEDCEFVELYNPGAVAASLSGWKVGCAVGYTFPDNCSIAPGEHLVVARRADCYSGLGCRVYEWERGKLANRGEALCLLDAGGAEVDYVRFDDRPPWDAGADGDGPSLELRDAGAANTMPGSWCASAVAGGTPGEPNSCGTTE
ncbi:CotH kinase family protein, partial [Thermodesulfobacteriota bacterium]